MRFVGGLTKRHWALLLLGMAATGVVVLLILNILVSAATTEAIRAQQKQTAPKINSTEETLRLVRDCVSPGGMCYQRSRDQAEKQVAASSYAAACAANGLKSADEIYECVQLEFEKRKVP